MLDYFLYSKEELDILTSLQLTSIFRCAGGNWLKDLSNFIKSQLKVLDYLVDKETKTSKKDRLFLLHCLLVVYMRLTYHRDMRQATIWVCIYKTQVRPVLNHKHVSNNWWKSESHEGSRSFYLVKQAKQLTSKTH